MPAKKKELNESVRKLPEDLIVWKKARVIGSASRKMCLIKLRLPKNTLVNLCFDKKLLNYRKCRASRAEVLAFYAVRGGKKLKDSIDVRSMYRDFFKYKIGSLVRPDRPFDKSRGPCESGIHFFLKREDAKKYRS